jgi:hypothetical protein
MSRGIVGLELGEGAEVGAPRSGVQLGTGASGPVVLRLFRVAGTRVVVTSRLLPAQLIVIRVAAAGTPVQVVSSRPQLWEPLLRHDPRAHVVSATEVRQAPGGPTLVVDDRPAEVRSPGEVGPWQCRLDVRAQWAPSEVGSFAYTDLAVFGPVGAELTGRIASAFGLPAPSTQGLAGLDGGTFGVLRRGRIEYVTLDPTQAEQHALEQVEAFRPVPAPR